jgi:hypothetical protein
MLFVNWLVVLCPNSYMKLPFESQTATKRANEIEP